MRTLTVFSRRASGRRRLPRQARRIALGRRFRFFQTDLGRSAAAHVAGGEIQHAGAIALLGHADQGAAASLLDIVRVRGDGENVERLFDGRRSGVDLLPHVSSSARDARVARLAST